MTMREKMARAMCISRGLNPDEPCGDLSKRVHTRQVEWQTWLEVADAALDALMEPTPGMCSSQVHGEDFAAAGLLSTWQAMIRAAKEGK